MTILELIKTKTFWTGVIAIAAGIIEAVFDGWSQGAEKMLLGVGMIVGRQAVGKAAKGKAQ